MIKSLKHRVQEEIIRFSNEVEGLSDVNTPSSYNKLCHAINMYQKRLMEINQETSLQEQQCHE